MSFRVVLIAIAHPLDYHNTRGPQEVTRFSPSSLSRVFRSAGEELGYKTVDYNGREMIGILAQCINSHIWTMFL
ncbi:hypothetical protein DPMN_103579 [Dreissena polymorpha]|uniref:Uncharacterized protein n=1 Tax=Dreissena polymorpha TaxID=45954 RepID=A0A9D4H8Q6_DREPO|nr:hypothetical protein DPMN_103579 [Dreissena polymorpha]